MKAAGVKWIMKFQFTPLREGRPATRRGAFRPVPHFNSRPSARGDPFRGREVLFRRISIHAPPRGATSQGCWRRATKSFQFTPLREGRRPFRGREVLFRRISIHAPPRGATYDKPFWGVCEAISIHAPPRGATPAPWQGKRPAPYFNSRPSARGDKPAPWQGKRPAPYFNSRPSARGD